MHRVALGRILGLTALAFSLSFTVGVLEPAVLGHKILQLASSSRNTALGFITFAGLLMATLTQPVVGVWSDRANTRLGRRVPFVAGGTLLVVVFLFLIAYAPVFAVLAGGYVAFQLGSNTAQAPWQTVFREHVPAHQRGMASGIRAIYEVLGALVGRLVAGQLVGLVPSLGENAVVLTIVVAVIVALATGTVVAISMRRSEADAQMSADSIEDASVPGDAGDQVAPGFAWVCVNRFFFWLGFMAVTTFLLFFVIDVLGYSEHDAQKLIGKLSAVLGVVLVASLVPVGRLADRIGRRPLVQFAGALAAAGTVSVVLVRSIAGLTLSAGCIGLGIGMYMSASWALVTDLVPSRSAARYLGIANTAGASGNAMARLAGGALIDWVNRATGTHTAGYRTAYIAAAASFGVSTLAALMIPRDRMGVHGAPT